MLAGGGWSGWSQRTDLSDALGITTSADTFIAGRAGGEDGGGGAVGRADYAAAVGHGILRLRLRLGCT